MNIIDAAMNRSRTVLSLLAFLLLAGAMAYVAIPKEADPDVNIPIIYVSMSLEGISPEDGERLLVRPMEQKLQAIEGVKEMRSNAHEGGASVLLEFEAGFDADQALTDVREQVDTATPDLPEDADEPQVHEVNLSQFPILVVTLSGDVSERLLLALARRLQDRIQTIPAVLEAEITGDRDEAVEVLIDPVIMESYGLEARDVFLRFNQSNRLIAAGAMDNGAGRFAVKLPGLFEDAEDVMTMPLINNDDAVVRAADVARLQRTFKDPENFARLNGVRALALNVSKRTGENIIETVEAVRGAVLDESRNWPEAIKIGFNQDKSGQIRIMLTDLQNNVMAAVLLVMIVIVGILGLRGGLLVGIAIPGSFLTGVLILSALGFTVNIVVLFALILAVGMLVDGAIVVSEYADRKLGEGVAKTEAYALAAKRMSWPIIASTATTLAAFLPLMFWPGIVGEFMKFLPITLIATLSASLAMALVFVPVLGANMDTVIRLVIALVVAALCAFAIGAIGAALVGQVAGLLAIPAGIGGFYGGWRLGGYAVRILDSQPGGKDAAATLSGSSAGEGESDTGALMTMGGLTGVYVRTLDRALRRPRLILLVAGVTLIGTWGIYATFGKGVEFFPAVEPEEMVVNVHGRGNLSVHEKDLLVGEVEALILTMQDAHGEFRAINVTAGNFGGNNELAEDVIGTIHLEFIPWEGRRTAAVITDEIRRQAAGLAGIRIEVAQPEAGPPVGKPIHMQLSGAPPAVLDAAVAVITAKLRSMPEMLDIEDSRPIPGIVWNLEVDRAQASKFGADMTIIGGIIQMITRGYKISAYRPDDSDEEVDILLRFPEGDRTLDRLDHVRINTHMGETPIGNFVTRSAEPRTGTILRVDGQRIMYVKADVTEGVLPDDMVRALQAWLKDERPLPDGVEVSFKGENEEQAKAQAFLGKAFAVALFLMAVILVTQFNRFYSAFLILSAVIMSTVGVLIGLLIMGMPFGIVMSGIGVIALAGIVVNNNIVLIDTFDRLSATGMGLREAILRTGAQRLRPVLLTTTTTILGLLPMVTQVNINFITRHISVGAPSSQWWVQLSTAIVFGLSFATVLTLVITPSALMAWGEWQERRAAKLRARHPDPPAGPGADAHAPAGAAGAGGP